MGIQQVLTPRERTARRRAALRRQGFRPRQVWLPDLRNAGVQAEITRACAVIAASDQHGDLAFAEALQYWPEDTAA